MLPDRVSNPGPLTYESGALPMALRGLVKSLCCDLTHEHLINATIQICICMTKVLSSISTSLVVLNLKYFESKRSKFTM